MPVRPIKYKYGLQNRYPGMRIRDEVIWDEYVKKHPHAFNFTWYNVPLGDPFPDPDKKILALANGGYEVGQWRIDVLAEGDDGLVVIEVKPNADSRALGEALAYTALLKKEWGISAPVVPVVLTDKMSPILEQAAKLMGVVVIVP